MVTKNYTQLELDFNHPNMRVGLDRAHCPDCSKEFQPWSKEYSQALTRSRGYQVGDRVTILQESPSRIYKIVKLSGAAHAHCQPLDGAGNNRRVPFWKIRPACAIGGADHSPLNQVSGAESQPAPDSWGKGEEPVGGADHSPLNQVSGAESQPAPDSWGKREATKGGAQSTPLGSASHTHWAEVYRPNRRRTEYFRYVWMEGRRLRHVHIPGGHVRSCDAQGNLLEIELAIRQGRSPHEIKELIVSLRIGSKCE